MPRRRNIRNVKPSPSVHPSLEPSRPDANSTQPGSSRSVNQLLQNLRASSPHQASSPSWHSTGRPRSVPPSIRNLLDLPETLPPQLSHASRPMVGQRRQRRTPGPAAPRSWTDQASQTYTSSVSRNILGKCDNKSTRRIDRLPGVKLPAESSLLHATLRSMATNWSWHLAYDGAFLATLPTHIKQLLLSYIVGYSDYTWIHKVKGLEPLFLESSDANSPCMDDRSQVTRLDLSISIGHWLTVKQLSKEVGGDIPFDQVKDNLPVPNSWEDEADSKTPNCPRLEKNPLNYSNFGNLRYLSLASPVPAAADWIHLLKFLSHVPTLTHLSLAHWPLPVLATKKLSTIMCHPMYNDLSVPYRGPDIYSPYEYNWVEPAIVLSKLCKLTHRLKWLELEGCCEWIPALCWNGVDVSGDTHSTRGPDWNGSWRGIEWLGLGLGWTPMHLAESIHLMADDSMYQWHRDQQLHAQTTAKMSEIGQKIQNIRKEGRGKRLQVSLAPWPEIDPV
ncbi:hypothetical protein FQN57_005938 [Myotisia sp. PD_48]|nr:hypothetical protein FQN57_005938 [Myotisia sp. PD_48]